MRTNLETTELLIAVVARHAPLFHRSKRGEGMLTNYRIAVVPAAETLSSQTMQSFAIDYPPSVAPFAFGQHATDEVLINFSFSVAMVSRALDLRLREVSLTKYIDIPSARFALYNGISRYIAINNAYPRKSEKAAPVAQYNEMAPASPFLSWALFPHVERPAAVTQVNPGLARNHLSCDAKIPSLCKVQASERKPAQGQESPRKPPKKMRRQALRASLRGSSLARSAKQSCRNPPSRFKSRGCS